jgi:hypothetical protein
MKTEQQIKDKIKEHEDKIEELLITKYPLWEDTLVAHIENYLIGRKALLWTLFDKELLIGADDFEKRVRFEISCYKATQIF